MTKDRYSHVFIDNGWGKSAAKYFRARRKRLAEAVSEPVVLWGVPHAAGHPYSWAVIHAPVFQDPFMLYLTGINQPGIAVLMYQTETGQFEDILFLPNKDANAEFWEGAKLGYEKNGDQSEVKKRTGFSQILPISDLKKSVAQAAKAHSIINTFWHKAKSKDIQQLFRWSKADRYEVKSIGSLRWRQALNFDAQDLQNLRAGHAKTAAIFDAILRQIPNATAERHIHAAMQSEIALATSKGPAFAPIIASGRNAAVLHYTKNDDDWSPNELLLLDFGIRHPLIVTDVTRTVPISGQFNALQKLLYEIVLETQLGVEKRAKAGVSIQLLNEWCWTQIGILLDQRFYAKGGKATMAYAANKPHFVSHLIGYAVHDGDPSREYRHQPLEAGMIISNEPGIYGEFEITLNGTQFHEVIGIRIEDDLLITKTGCEVLSAAIPKSVAEIEKRLAAAYRNS